MDGINFMVIHRYFEDNQAADFLAKIGEQGLNNCYIGHSNLPTYLKGIVWIDSLGIPNLKIVFWFVYLLILLLFGV